MSRALAGAQPTNGFPFSMSLSEQSEFSGSWSPSSPERNTRIRGTVPALPPTEVTKNSCRSNKHRAQQHGVSCDRRRFSTEPASGEKAKAVALRSVCKEHGGAVLRPCHVERPLQASWRFVDRSEDAGRSQADFRSPAPKVGYVQTKQFVLRFFSVGSGASPPKATASRTRGTSLHAAINERF